MPRVFKIRSKKIGQSPGTLIHVGERKTHRVRITLMEFAGDHFEERDIESLDECLPLKGPPLVTWLNIDGIHQLEPIEKIGTHFNLHPLLLEDLLNTDQRPKMEDYEEHLFLVIKMLTWDEGSNELHAEQVSLIVGSHYLISFQEQPGDVFDPVRRRIRAGKIRMRTLGSGYLAYALMDTVVDQYFSILERLGERIEDLEEELLSDSSVETLQSIHELKREMVYLRKAVWPLREVVSGLQRGESPLLDHRTGLYLRDVYDHIIQVVDTVETFRDLLSGMVDLYMSATGNRMNEVMKVLTIIATIFIPLTFIAGIYGMNFEYMPELRWRWGYFLILGAMGLVSIGMVLFFRRRKWL